MTSASARLVAVLVGAAIFAAALAAFAIGLSSPAEPYFDETWYVPAARSLLVSGEMLRQEHPPLGKLLIALGMALFGDNPIGWRAMSCVFGALTIVGIYAWTLASARSVGSAVYAALLGALGAEVYVQARIAMLDIFLMAFGVWAVALFLFSLREGISRRLAFGLLSASGASVGLATACKESGAFLWAGLLSIALVIAMVRHWGAVFRRPAADDFASAARWRGMTLAHGVIALGLAPLLAYCATYLQQIIHIGSLGELVASHLRMREIMSGDSGTHPYSSNWWSWPALIRPVWYYFKIPGGDAKVWSDTIAAEGVVGLANPVLTLLGELAVLACLLRWALTRSLASLVVATAFFSQYLPWIINPKGLEFSYYFFPSLMAVGPAFATLLTAVPGRRLRLGLASAVLAVALAGFVFFLPVLNAAVGGLSPSAFEARVWLPTWR